MYMCVRGINIVSFYDFTIGFCKCSDNVICFVFHLMSNFHNICFHSVFSVVLGAITYRPIGCVHGGGIHPLPNLQNNFRNLIDWYNLQLIVEQCVTEAYSSGFSYFGIEFWGECWVSHTFNITSFSLVVGSECETICYSGVAAAKKQFIYEIL